MFEKQMKLITQPAAIAPYKSKKNVPIEKSKSSYKISNDQMIPM